MKIIVCSKEFKSKKELEKYTRDLLNSARTRDIEGAELEFLNEFLNELIKRHPDAASIKYL